MTAVSLKELLESGVHFGHQTKRWNPKMKRYIFEARNGIYIINLQKTLFQIHEAVAFVRKIVKEGKSVLFVCTKKPVNEVVRECVQSCGMYYVTNRWLGGMLTNFQTIQKSVKRLKQLETMEQNGVLASLSKKDYASAVKELAKLKIKLEGIKNMESMPGAVFVVDIKKEEIAVKEARRLGIPVVAIVDTICDPEMVDYVIAGNDDAIRSVKLISTLVCEAVKEEKSAYEEAVAAAKKEQEKAAAQQAAAEDKKPGRDSRPPARHRIHREKPASSETPPAAPQQPEHHDSAKTKKAPAAAVARVKKEEKSAHTAADTTNEKSQKQKTAKKQEE